MVFFNWATMQMAAKIVYYGPGLCGKTSNLSHIYAKTAPTSRGEMVSLETESDRTLFFDLLPIEVGTIGGFKTRLQLYTVPGQVFYNTTRKLVLKGVDGLVFVADSQRPMREANLESFASLRKNLEELGLDINDLPLVLQYNKRDLKQILSVEELNNDLNGDSAYPFHESSAINGDGVFETLKEITKLTLKKLRKRMAAPEAAARAKPTTSIRPSAQPESRRPTAISAAALARAAEEGVESSEVVSAEADGAAVDAPPPTADSVPFPGDEAAGDVASAAAAAAAEPTFEPEAPPEVPDPRVVVPDEPAVESAATQLPEPGKEEPEGESPFVAEQVSEPVVGKSTSDAGVGLNEKELSPAEPTPEGVADTAFQAEGEEETDPEVVVDFDKAELDAKPPPLKRVQVTNQMDILAELDSLRKEATMSSVAKGGHQASPELDLDSLLGAGTNRHKELRRRIAKPLNSDVFQHMHALQLAVRIQDVHGETIHILDPVSLHVEKAGGLDKISLQFTIDLENLQ